MQHTWSFEGDTYPGKARIAPHRSGGRKLRHLSKALVSIVVSLLHRRLSRLDAALPPPLTGFVRGESVRLPKGERIAAEDVEFRHTGFGEEAVATGPEAWIAIRVGRASIWYALWYDAEQRWELLGV